MNYDDQTKVENKLLRVIFMVLFVLIYKILDVVLLLISAGQYLFQLVTDKDNETLRQLGDGLSCYFFQIFRYLTYNTEEKPFPFSDWPTSSKDMAHELEKETKEQ